LGGGGYCYWEGMIIKREGGDLGKGKALFSKPASPVKDRGGDPFCSGRKNKKKVGSSGGKRGGIVGGKEVKRESIQRPPSGSDGEQWARWMKKGGGGKGS